jgi:hypothetical protein
MILLSPLYVTAGCCEDPENTQVLRARWTTCFESLPALRSFHRGTSSPSLMRGTRSTLFPVSCSLYGVIAKTRLAQFLPNTSSVLAGRAACRHGSIRRRPPVVGGRTRPLARTCLNNNGGSSTVCICISRIRFFDSFNF